MNIIIVHCEVSFYALGYCCICFSFFFLSLPGFSSSLPVLVPRSWRFGASCCPHRLGNQLTQYGSPSPTVAGGTASSDRKPGNINDLPPDRKLHGTATSETMICRACLRARRVVTDVLPAQSRSLLPASSSQLQLSRAAPSLPQSQLQQSRTPNFQRRSLSTTAALQSASAQPDTTASSQLEKPNFLAEGESQVWDRLAAEFAPTQLVVQDISGGCGSMYGIEISSERFRGLTMLKQQRLVNAALGDLMKEWHGVQLKTRVP